MTASNPLITVGMPIYNGEQYISTAIESILNQSIRDFELIISDNASTDSTEEICRSYAKLDHRIIYGRQRQNIGAPRNWNYVFTQRKGKYFKWASSNDICHPRMLEKCLQVLEERQDVVLCYPKTKLIDSNGEVTAEYEDLLNLQEESASERFIKLLTDIALNNAQNGLIRSDILEKTSLEGVYQNGDITLMAELCLYGKFHEIPEFLFFRREAPGAVTSLRTNREKRFFNNPDSSGWLYLPMLQYYLGLYSAVFRCPVKQGEKFRLYYYLLKRLAWDRKSILQEFGHSLRGMINNLVKTRSPQ